jgi:aminoglycoside phosphotransferase (APT) family kinase protein
MTNPQASADGALRPLAPEDLTPEWLTRALEARFPGVRVAALELVDAHAGTTGRARLRVSYERAAGAPEALFVKLPPGDPGQRIMVQVTGMGRKEARFYAELAGEVPVRVPAPLFAAWNEAGDAYVMGMEDLEVAGCRFPAFEAGAAADHAGRVVESLARLHGRFWEDPRFAGELSWVERPMRWDLARDLIAQAVALHGEEMPAAFSRIGNLFAERSEVFYDLWEEGEQTLVHGDPHLANLFLDGETPGFLDWGVVGRAPGMRDVGHFLCSSLEPEVRRAGEKGWIEGYLRVLEQAGAPAPSFDATWRRYALHAAYSWVAAASTLAVGDRWQPPAYARSGVLRATQAVEDLGTLDRVRAA